MFIMSNLNLPLYSETRMLCQLTLGRSEEEAVAYARHYYKVFVTYSGMFGQRWCWDSIVWSSLYSHSSSQIVLNWKFISFIIPTKRDPIIVIRRARQAPADSAWSCYSCWAWWRVGWPVGVPGSLSFRWRARCWRCRTLFSGFALLPSVSLIQ